MATHKILIMGVSGCGKSAVGSQLGKTLNIDFFDGDHYHSAANIEKMSQGTPLNDQDRQGWLEALNVLIHNEKSAIVACSALTPAYRKILAEGNPELQFVYLKGDFDTIWQRHQKRDNHYFNGQALLKNQFETLVEPSSIEALIVDIRQTVEEISAEIQTRINKS